MKVQEQDYDVLRQFLQEIHSRVEELDPFLRAFAEDPERREIEEKVISGCHHLYHSMRGTGGFLGLRHIIYLAEAFELLLDHARSNLLFLQAPEIELLQEGGDLLKSNLAGVWQQKSDALLSEAVRELAAKVRRKADYSLPDAVSAPALTEDMRQDQLESFLEETRQLLETAEQEFILWEFITIDHDRVADLCAIVGRLKGNFALFDLTEPERICQAMEGTLHRFLQGEVYHSVYPEQVFIRIVDALRETVDRFALSGEANVTGGKKHLQALQGLVRKPIGELLIQAGLVAPQVVEAALQEQKKDDQLHPRRLGEVLVDMGELSENEIDQVLGLQHEQHRHSRKAMEAQSRRAEHGREENRPNVLPAVLSIPRETVARLCSLVNQVIDDQQGDTLSPPLAELQELCKPLHNVALGIMLPRLKRIVHDMAIQTGKKVCFAVTGEKAVFTDEVIDQLYDPIVELLVNGIVHGLEKGPDREKLGKKNQGRLQLTFIQAADELWISVEDDGCGFPFANLASLAVERGFLHKGDIGTVNDRQLLDLVLEHGLTTKSYMGTEQQPSASGLMQVRRQIISLGGRMEILSRMEKGTRVTLRMPRDSHK